MKSDTIRSYLCATVTLIFICLEFTVAQETINCSHKALSNKAPKYRIGYRLRAKDKPSALRLHISIGPKYFNRADMIALAKHLNKDFQREKELDVVICDDYETAKSPGIIYDLLKREPPLALRGFYELDRGSSKEGISFSTERGKPLDEIDINLSSSP